MGSFTVTADSPEQFNELREMALSLPETILEQVISVEEHFGITRCKLKRPYGGDNMNIYLPKDKLKTMVDCGSYFGIHADDFYFEIPKESQTFIFNFI